MKNLLSSKKTNAMSILLDGAFAFACFFSVVCAALLVSVYIITKDQTGVVGFQLTPNESGFSDVAVGLVGLFSDRIFTGRFNTFVSDPYLKISLICSLVTAVLAAVAIRFASRPVHTAAFGGELFSKKNTRALTVASSALLVMAVVPLILKMGLVENGDNLSGLYSVNGAVLAIILFFASFLIACGADLLPKEESGLDDEQTSRSTAISKLGQNSRALISVLWLAVIAVGAAAAWMLISIIPLLPYLGVDALVEQDPAGNTVLSIMLGTLDKLQYTPFELIFRYAWELAALIVALIALISGCKVLNLTKKTDTAFSDDTVKALKRCSLLTLICSLVLTAGSIVSCLLTDVRCDVAVCGFICSAALLWCAKLVSRVKTLKDEKEKRELEAQEDISDLSFILR